METRASRSEESEKVFLQIATSVLLMALGTVAWLLFAVRLAEDDPTTWLGLWLGIAVSLTVFAAAAAVRAGMTSLHYEQMRALRDRS